MKLINLPVTEETKQRLEVADLRKNLDKLQSLHHKLAAMLEELNDLYSKKEKRK